MIQVTNRRSRVPKTKREKQENAPDLLVLSLQTIGNDPFDKLIELCKPITYGVTKRYFFPDYEREDFLQEARSVLIKSVGDWKIEKGMPFLQYYHMQLSNHLNMLVRKNHAQKRRVNLETSSLDNLVEEAGIHVQGRAAKTTHPEEMTIMHETLDKYLLDLSPFESQVFDLFIKGQDYGKICDELTVPLDKVQNALYRCRVKLVNLIK